MSRIGQRLRMLAGVVVVAAVLTACEAAPPDVTWYGNRTSVAAGPALFCELSQDLTPTCSVTDGPIAQLSLHAEDAVQVNIPAEVAEQPWLLVISYADGSSSTRTPLIDDGGKTLSWTVYPAGHPLQHIELQVLTLTSDAAGQVQFTPLQVWALAITQLAG